MNFYAIVEKLRPLRNERYGESDVNPRIASGNQCLCVIIGEEARVFNEGRALAFFGRKI